MTVLPSVSVVLPTFNRETFIAEAIGSLLAQTVKPDQIVVVDDGSTDGTAAVLAGFGTQITYVRQDSAGKLTAIANGLDHSDGDLVWVMDDDDLATPDALENLARPFARNPALVMTYGRMTRFDNADPQGSEHEVPYPEDTRPFLVQMMEDCFITGHPCVLVRRDALEAMRPFDKTVIASVDYYLHLGVAQTGPVEFVDSVVLRQRQHDGLRGPARNRYTEAERNAKWIAHDAYLLRKMLDNLPLHAFLDSPPWNAAPLDEGRERMALIQRAVIAGRKKLWPEATEGLRRAMQIMRDVPLTAMELRILNGMLGSRYGIDELYDDPAILAALQATCAGRSDCTEVLTALSRPLLHEIKIAARERNFKRAASAVRGWTRLMDSRATRVALQAAVGRNLARAGARIRL